MTRPMLSIEVPLKHLDEFHEDQDYIFTLSFLFKEKLYQDYVLRNKKHHILDNSYNELGRPQSATEMIEIMKQYNASMIVAPDSDDWSFGDMIQSYSAVAARVGINSTLGVARTLTEITALTRLNAPYIALPYEHRLCLPPQGVKTNAKLHFLGLNNIMEVFVYSPISIDTSMPVKIALLGMTVDEWVMNSCPHIHTKDLMQSDDFFNMKMSKNQIKLSKTNINRLKEIFNHGPEFDGILH